MTAIAQSIEKHHRLIITLLVMVIAFMASSCLFHDVIPICHWLFGCDHKLHAAASMVGVS